jgi:hypothetical protein
MRFLLDWANEGSALNHALICLAPGRISIGAKPMIDSRLMQVL